MTDDEVRAAVGELEALLERLEPSATEAVELLLRLYGETLRRIVAALHDAPRLAATLAEDELVGHVLLLHDLHPASLEERVRRALEEVRPILHGHGGNVELIEIAGDVARVRFAGSCAGCAASTATLKLAIEEAVLRGAPELRGVEDADAEAAGVVVLP